MIPKSRLQEFGFSDPGKFPRHLSHYAVTLSLPSALDRGLPPLELIIDDGLVIPLQVAVSSGGMIVKRDGTMLHIGHREPNNSGSPLESRFTQDIPYDTRAEVYNIMRRAVGADPSLAGIWQDISAAWIAWFPAFEGEGSIKAAGEFKEARQVWVRVEELIDQLLRQFNDADGWSRVNVKVIVQNEENYQKGWMGEEISVLEVPLHILAEQGRTRFMLRDLFPKMKNVLSSPLFSTRSAFRLYYGLRQSYIIKIVIVPPGGDYLSLTDSAGIDFTV